MFFRDKTLSLINILSFFYRQSYLPQFCLSHMGIIIIFSFLSVTYSLVFIPIFSFLLLFVLPGLFHQLFLLSKTRQFEKQTDAKNCH